MRKIILKVWGGCDAMTREGEWIYRLIDVATGVTKVMRGECHDTTHCTMAREAIALGLEALNEPCEVEVMSNLLNLVQQINREKEYPAPYDSPQVIRITEQKKRHKVSGTKIKIEGGMI